MKEKVLNYLKTKNGCGPTEIGLALGKSYQTASSSVMPALKYLVKQGVVKREITSSRKVVYKYISK